MPPAGRLLLAVALLATSGLAAAEAAPLECSAAWAGYGLEMLPGLSHTGHPTGANWSGFGPTQRLEWRAILDANRDACRRNFDAHVITHHDRRRYLHRTGGRLRREGI